LERHRFHDLVNGKLYPNYNKRYDYAKYEKQIKKEEKSLPPYEGDTMS